MSLGSVIALAPAAAASCLDLMNSPNSLLTSPESDLISDNAASYVAEDVRPSSAALPLVVDLDGTLTPTDTLVESLVQLIKRKPPTLLKLPFWLMRGRAAFKHAVASQTAFSADSLPIRPDLLAFLRAERASGRRIILATAAHSNIAEAVATRLAVFDEVLASDAGRNLKGAAKLEAIQQTVGNDFVYAGDSRADLPIWQKADAAILVGASRRLADTVRNSTRVEREFPRAPVGLALWLRALRVHQWTKNLLLLVPMLTGFAFFESAKLAAMAMAFLAFSLAASATYVVNDLWDLDSDRVHPRKRNRPFASAMITIPAGVVVAAMAMIAALLLAAAVSTSFLLILLLYIVLTSAYSWALKQYVLIDVLMLSMLYTLRILAGAIAVQVAPSSWLLAFSVFMFFSLALVKRCSELVSLEQSGRLAASGRDYRVSDLVVLWPLGVAASLSAIVVFGLFISAPATQARYASGQLLWLVAVGLIYWSARLWIKTARGEMHDDPIVFALRDFGSCVVIGAMMCVTVAAHFLVLG
ncbi:MAG: 4-hydroxybenzoate polyprenyltransferase [Massilia sp.]|jgi:4-hydroxybenzoate polyprenyltransferase/phosphoserine phosphatase|nr:4-hydroxybenzoate polyprenyltransferase [Massilia sp.]